MFPPSLQKNIRELDRQISLLETECENMEAENRDTSGKINSKVLIREMSNKPFVPNSCPSSHSHKMLILPPVTPRTHSSSCAHKKAMNSDNKNFGDSQNSQERFEKKEGRDGGDDVQEDGGEDIPRGNTLYEVKQANFGEKKEVNGQCEAKKSHREMEKSLKVTEFGTDSYPIRVKVSAAKQKNISENRSKEKQTWCDLIKDEVLADKGLNEENNKAGENRESIFDRNPVKTKFCSDEERSRSIQFATGESIFLSEKWIRELERPITSQSKLSTKRRSRSVRTKTSEKVPLDMSIANVFHEKETQCLLWSEDREKTEFLQNLNESIKTLQLLMEELKTKSSREKRNNVLNDMQNIIMKISTIKSINALQNPLSMLSSLKGINVRSIEGEDNLMDQKRTILALKKFCQELSEEKSALTEELNTKNCKIASLKNKEKEYLSLISNLKFNLEGLKEEAEDGKLAKRDLMLVKAKLREEAKVIEVLKKSHGKMQALIEHYVLENDKLRAEVKMTKLELQKFNVLLAGKEVEISKYKQEIELFQRQINQQLCSLRSKATEKEVEHAMEVISAQANIIQTEVDSLPSETTLEKREQSLNLDLRETTSSIKKMVELRTGEEESRDRTNIQNKKQGETELMKSSSSSRELKDVDANVKDGGFTSCKSDDSLVEGRMRDNHAYSLGLQGVLSTSKNLRSSVNEMLQDMQSGSMDKFWPSLSNSSNTSQCSVVSSYTENVSECDQRD